MSKLVELGYPTDREELSIRKRELRELRSEIKEVARSPFLTPNQKEFKIKELREVTRSVQADLKERRENIFSNYS